jgi:hypothetical protein
MDKFAVYSADDAPPGRGGILLTTGQLEEWAGRALSQDEIARITDAIPHSTVPEAIGLIADGMKERDNEIHQ